MSPEATAVPPDPRRRRLGWLVAMVLGIGVAVAFAAWFATDWMRADLARAVRRVRELRVAEGYAVVPLGQAHVGHAGQGERVTFPFTLAAPGELAVVAVCDGDCSSLGLRLLDASGEPLAADVWGDSIPLIFAMADVAGDYGVEVDVRACGSGACRYAFQILRLEAPLSAGADSTTGTCFAVGPDGHVLTALHVVADAKEIDVTFIGGPPRRATLERRSDDADVALLRLEDPTPDYLTLADDGAVRLGEPVFTIGFPAVDILGEAPKYNDGTVGALEGMEGGPPTLQLSIPVQPGSSGGPVVNDHGEVVGVVESVADAEFFRDSNGLVQQSLSWAVQAGAVRDLVPDEEPLPPTPSRAEAVERVLGAVCLVEAR